MIRFHWHLKLVYTVFCCCWIECFINITHPCLLVVLLSSSVVLLTFCLLLHRLLTEKCLCLLLNWTELQVFPLTLLIRMIYNYVVWCIHIHDYFDLCGELTFNHCIMFFSMPGYSLVWSVIYLIFDIVNPAFFDWW